MKRRVIVIVFLYVGVLFGSLEFFKEKGICEYDHRLSPAASSQIQTSQLTQGATSFFYPQSNRNPFLSPMDYETIQKIELERKKREELLKQLAEEQKKGGKKEVVDDFLKSMKLQGIVGRYAIINGDMVEEGGYYKKKALIEKVGSNYVIINYKGKRHKLVIK